MSEYLRFRDGFAEALDYRFYPIEYLDHLVAIGQAFLWFGVRSAIAAEVRDYPGGARVIHGLCATGDLEEITNTLIPQAEAFGAAVGCTHAIVESRPGWARLLQKHGYGPHQVAVRKVL